MLWNIRLDGETVYCQIQNNIKISKAVLDLETCSEESGTVSVWMRVNNQDILLANLCQQTSQSQIDIVIGENRLVQFYLRGNQPGSVHVIGYYIIDDENVSENASYATSLKTQSMQQPMQRPPSQTAQFFGFNAQEVRKYNKNSKFTNFDHCKLNSMQHDTSQGQLMSNSSQQMIFSGDLQGLTAQQLGYSEHGLSNIKPYEPNSTQILSKLPQQIITQKSSAASHIDQKMLMHPEQSIVKSMTSDISQAQMKSILPQQHMILPSGTGEVLGQQPAVVNSDVDVLITRAKRGESQGIQNLVCKCSYS